MNALSNVTPASRLKPTPVGELDLIDAKRSDVSQLEIVALRDGKPVRMAAGWLDEAVKLANTVKDAALDADSIRAIREIVENAKVDIGVDRVAVEEAKIAAEQAAEGLTGTVEEIEAARAGEDDLSAGIQSVAAGAVTAATGSGADLGTNAAKLATRGDVKTNIDVFVPAMTFYDRSALQGSVVPAAVKRLRIQHFSLSHVDFNSAHDMRRSTADECARYDAGSWSTSNGGTVYWLIDEPRLTPYMVGVVGHPNDNSPTVGIVDETAGMAAWMKHLCATFNETYAALGCEGVIPGDRVIHFGPVTVSRPVVVHVFGNGCIRKIAGVNEAQFKIRMAFTSSDYSTSRSSPATAAFYGLHGWGHSAEQIFAGVAYQVDGVTPVDPLDIRDSLFDCDNAAVNPVGFACLRLRDCEGHHYTGCVVDGRPAWKGWVDADRGKFHNCGIAGWRAYSNNDWQMHHVHCYENTDGWIMSGCGTMEISFGNTWSNHHRGRWVYTGPDLDHCTIKVVGGSTDRNGWWGEEYNLGADHHAVYQSMRNFAYNGAAASSVTGQDAANGNVTYDDVRIVNKGKVYLENSEFGRTFSQKVISDEKVANHIGYGPGSTGSVQLGSGNHALGGKIIQSAVRAESKQVFVPPANVGFERPLWDKMDDMRSVFDWIPPTIAAAVKARTNTADLATYINAAILASSSLDFVLYFPAYEYLCSNLSLPTNLAYGSGMPLYSKMPRLVGAPGACIKKKSSADNTYLIASDRWITDSPDGGGKSYAAGPFWLENIRFDGAGIANDVCPSLGYQTTVRCCIFENGLRHGYREAQTTKAGTTVRGHRAKNFHQGNKYRTCAGTGFIIENSTDSYVTDGLFLECDSYDNGHALDFQQCSGWTIRNNHTWNYAVAPAEDDSWLVRIGLGSVMTCSDNIFECAPNLPAYANPTTKRCYGLWIDGGGTNQTFTGNRIPSSGDVRGVNVTFAGGQKRVVLSGFIFEGLAALRHSANDSSCKLVSRGNQFATSTPYLFAGNASVIDSDDHVGNGVIKIKGHQTNSGAGLIGATSPGNKYLVRATYPTGYTVSATDPETLLITEPLTADYPITFYAGLRGCRHVIVRHSAATNSGGTWYLVLKQADGTTVIRNVAATTTVTVEHDGVIWRVFIAPLTSV